MFDVGHTADNTITMSAAAPENDFLSLQYSALNDNRGFIVGNNDYLKRYTVHFNELALLCSDVG